MKLTIIPLLILGVVFTLLPLRSGAQPTPYAPGQISYQGYLTDANGIALASTSPSNYTIIFRIYDASTSGNLKWAEQQIVTVDRGYFTVMLGSGSSVPGAPWTNNLTSVFSGSTASDRYLGMTVLELSSSEIAPRLRLLASPYALLATKAMSVDTSTIVSDGNLSTNVALRSGGNTFSGNQTFLNNVGIGIASPPFRLTVNSGSYGIAHTDGTRTLSTYLDANGGWLGTYTADPLLFYVNKGFASMAIATNGNVGIGTTAPTAKLHVIGNENVSANLIVGGSIGVGTNTPGAKLDVNGTANVSANLLVNGNLGVGTNTPGARLDVNGSASVNGNLSVNGTISSTRWTVTNVINTTGPLGLSASFVSHGGTLLITASGSGWGGAGTIIGMGLNLETVGGAIGQCTIYATQAGTHYAFVPKTFVKTGVPAGTHTISLGYRTGTGTDANDFFSVTIEELPF